MIKLISSSLPEPWRPTSGARAGGLMPTAHGLTSIKQAGNRTAPAGGTKIQAAGTQGTAL